MPSPIPSMFGTVVIDAKSLFEASSDRAGLPEGQAGSLARDQLAEATRQLKRIVVEHKPRQLLLLHTDGFSESLDAQMGENYGRWKEIADVMGIPQETLPRKNIYGFIDKALNENRASGRPGLIISVDGLLGVGLENDIYYEDAESLSIYGKEHFIDQYGFDPNYLVEFYGLVGHKELSISGVDFIGPRKAAEWLEKVSGDPVEHIEKAYGDTRLGRIFVKQKEKFVKSLGAIEDIMSHPSSPVPSMMPDLNKNHALHEHFRSERVEPHREKINALLERFELFELLPKSEASDKLCHLDRISAMSAINSMSKAKSMSLYFEHDGDSKEVIGIGATDGRKAHGFPIQMATDYDAEWIRSKLSDLIERKNLPVVASDGKSYYQFFGDQARPLHADGSVLSYTINSGNGRSSFVDIASRFTPDVEFNHAPLSVISEEGGIEVGKFLAERSHVTLMLNRRLYEIASKTPSLNYYKKIEEPMARILAKMDSTGIHIDSDKIHEIKSQLEKRHESILDSINKRLPSGEQVDSLPKKTIEHLLFDVFRLTPPKVTQSNTRSVSDEALEKLEEVHWLPARIREYKKIGVILNSAINPILKRVEDGEGKIYPTFNQCVTITGRLSSTEPNVQGIPQKTPEGRRIREAFYGTAGYSIVAADYSQIELRILAHVSGDRNLLDAFKNGGDPHKATASEVFGVDIDKVTKEQRDTAKAINFGIVYGLTPYGLSKQLGVDESKASEFIDRYFDAFPGVKKYLDRVSQEGLENGYVDTLGGRRISLFSASQGATRREIEAVKRRACNYPMQGTAAEIIKKAMISADALLKNEFPEADLLMQVHDELVFKVPTSREGEFCERIKQVMESVSPLSVPLDVDIHAGPTWSEELEHKSAPALEAEEVTLGGNIR